MAAGIEMRVPFLDKSIYFKNISNIRNNKNLKFGKKELIKLLSKYLPTRLFKRPKAGFNPPIKSLINNLGYSEICKQLKNGNLFSYVPKELVMELLDKHFSKKQNNEIKLWQLLYLSFWLENYSL